MLPQPKDLYVDIGQGPHPRHEGAAPEASVEESDDDEDDAGQGVVGTPQDKVSQVTELDTLSSRGSTPTTPPWAENLLQQNCIFGLKEKIKQARAAIAQAKSLEVECHSFGVVDVVETAPVTPQKKLLDESQRDYPFAVEVGDTPSPAAPTDQEKLEKIEATKRRIAFLKGGLQERNSHPFFGECATASVLNLSSLLPPSFSL